MSYQAMWFRSAASQLKILDQSLDFSSVRAIISDRLPLLLQEIKGKGKDLEDPTYWWELVYIDGVIALENAQGKLMRVAIYMSDNWRLARTTLKIVQSRKFSMIRTDLGINQHWIIYTEAKHPHSCAQWVDLLYEQIDQQPQLFSIILVAVSCSCNLVWM